MARSHRRHAVRFHSSIFHVFSNGTFARTTWWQAPVFLLVLAVSAFAASNETAVYSFLGGSVDGMDPFPGLVFDSQGNAYGTTLVGGGGPCEYGCGIVFKLSPTQSGEWTETIIHHFDPSLNDAGGVVSRLTLDAQGNLYGAADTYLFELTPSKNGGEWTETFIHRFTDCNTDGCDAAGHLLFDSAGNLYGTTTGGGGAQGCGTVFKLAPQKNGSWKESILHVFRQEIADCSGKSADGYYPESGVIRDSAGNLYGTTLMGGPDDQGTVFRLAPTSQGRWKETLLHTFTGLEQPIGGASPWAGLVMDQAGNLYGTTTGGGNTQLQAGVVYELSPTKQGEWKETVLHNFPTPRYVDGEYSYTSVLIDSAGNLYGATLDGGGQQEPLCVDYDGCGIVFKLTPTQSGEWTETVLYAFQNGPDGGQLLDDALVMDAAGNLYGTTAGGGADSCDNGLANGCGVVFKIQQ
jgi:uncharacterized repeat protein (TIGR03803 family)